MSRFDSVGLFWEDIPVGRGEKRARVMPSIPETGWKPPKSFPNLSAAAAIAIDCETYDPDLLTKGPGWARGVGHIVGVSIGASGGGRWYFPMRHETMPQDNMSADIVLCWLRDILGNKNQPKVGANLLYDIGWLKQEGVEVKGELVDIQYAEALLDGSSRVALDVLGKKYLKEGKEANLLYRWLADYFGGNPDEKQRKHIHKAPPSLVGPYAESDVDLPLRIARKMYPLLAKEGLLDLFKMECGLIPLLVAMRFRGVCVDVLKAEELQSSLSERIIKEHEKLHSITGLNVNIASGASIAHAFDSLGLPYPLTSAGAPSFTKSYLESLNNPVANHIKEIRRLEKLKGTFIESYILNSHINGRVHGQFHPLRGDNGGAVSGRFASSMPNLQNIPARDEELAPLIRGLFLPDEGKWRKYDYSQIEYRFLVHYAIGPGSEEARQKYRNDPNTDYHDFTMDMVLPYTDWDVSTPAKRKHKRRPLKNINFGLVYGMGEKKLAGDLGMSLKEGKILFKAYHQALPFVRDTMNEAVRIVNNQGFITTILGRRARFDMWEPEGYGHEELALPYEQAYAKYGNIRRAYTHKAINSRLQGSAADQMKMVMYKAWECGLFDYIGVPHVTVHDELGMSDDGTKEDGFRELQHIAETVIPLSIPVKFESESGPDWGHTK